MSKTPTFASLFSGFRGADIGAQAAGFGLAWAVENDPAIAEVGAQLSGKVYVTDILDADPVDFLQVDALHASPPCPNYSIANVGRGETELDIALARKVCEFIRILQPKIFTLENVYGYRNGLAWRTIEDVLWESGYWVNMRHCNSADFGVPQTRKRMIVRAVRGGLVPILPSPEPWIGWYRAIADLIPTLPESKFANWQLARLPEGMSQFVLGNGTRSGCRDGGEPTETITGNSNQAGVKAFIMPGGGNTNFEEAYPGRDVRWKDEPSITVTHVTKNGGSMPRAFIIGSQYEQPRGTPDCRPQQRKAHEPIFTITSSGGMHKDTRAFIVDGQNAGRTTSLRQADHPALTVVSSDKGLARAWLSQGKVVSMTPRCLARFQSFPDWYYLPENNKLACKGIGNACPPLEFEKIYKQLYLLIETQ